MADLPAEEEEQPTGPERRCIVTGQIRPKAELLRFAVAPDGTLFPDPGHDLPGRGIWLSASRDVVNTAISKRLFARAAKRQVSVPDGLAERMEALLVRRCLDTLGLARRAGQAVCGFDKVAAELRSGRVALLLGASDAAADGKAKLRAMRPQLAEIGLFLGAELGAVFGRDMAVHVCVAQGRLAQRLKEGAALLAGFRG